MNKGQTGFYPGSSVARSSLSREFVNYFERDVPATVNSLFALFGALVLLFFYDVWSAAFCLVGSRNSGVREAHLAPPAIVLVLVLDS